MPPTNELTSCCLSDELLPAADSSQHATLKSEVRQSSRMTATSRSSHAPQQ